MRPLLKRFLRWWPEAVALAGGVFTLFLFPAPLRQVTKDWDQWLPLCAAPKIHQDGRTYHWKNLPGASSAGLFNPGWHFHALDTGKLLLRRDLDDLFAPHKAIETLDGSTFTWKVDATGNRFELVQLHPWRKLERVVFGPINTNTHVVPDPSGRGILVLWLQATDNDQRMVATYIDTANGQRQWTAPCSYWPIFCPAANTVLLGQDDHSWIHFTLNDLTTGRVLGRVPTSGELPLSIGAAFYPRFQLYGNGRLVAITSDGHRPFFELWDAVSGTCVYRLEQFIQEPSTAVEVSPQGEWVAIASGTGLAARIQVRNLNRPERSRTLAGELKPGLVVSPTERATSFLTERHLVIQQSRREGKTVLIYDLERDGPLLEWTAKDHAFYPRTLQALGDTKLLAEGEALPQHIDGLLGLLEQYKLVKNDFRQTTRFCRVYDLQTRQMLHAMPKVLAQRSVFGEYRQAALFAPNGRQGLLIEQGTGRYKITSHPLGGYDGQRLTGLNLLPALEREMHWLIALLVTAWLAVGLRTGRAFARRIFRRPSPLVA